MGTEDHLPFGDEAGKTGETEKHRFTNYERDSESGTDYAVNRQHLINSGRFAQPDVVAGSILYPQSLNRYSYVGNNPTNARDPLGLVKETVWSLWAGFSLLSTTNITWDGGSVPLYMLGMVAHLWASGAANIIPEGWKLNRPGQLVNPETDAAIDNPNDYWRLMPVQFTIPHPMLGKDLLKAFYCLFTKAGSGWLNTERSAWIVKSANSVSLVPWPWSAANKQESWKGPRPAGAIGIVHTHPNTTPIPSTTGGTTGEGDWGAAKQIGGPVFVLTLQAIWQITPASLSSKSPRNPVKIFNGEWWNPLEKAKTKC